MTQKHKLQTETQ